METTTNENLKETDSTQLPLIMLIDDSEIDNFVNNKIIRRYGFSDRILIYENSTEALNYLQKAESENLELPSIIFLDLNMPILNAPMFLEKFEELSTSLQSFCRIIILSSSGNPKDKSEMLGNKNVLAFLSKPLIKDNLDQISSGILKHQQRKPEVKIEKAIASIPKTVMCIEKKNIKTTFLSFFGWPLTFTLDHIQK